MSRSPAEGHPEALSKTFFGNFRRVPRVPEYPKQGESLRMSPELATCPECRSRNNPPSGSFPRETRVPECLNVHHIREPSEQATCPEDYSRQELPREIARVRHVSRDFTPEEPPDAPECATCPEPRDYPGAAR